MTWYYAVGNERQGPVDDAALDRLIASGVVTPDTLVWKAGMADWQPLSQARPRTVPAPTPVVPPPPAAIAPTPVSTPAPADPAGQPRFGTPVAPAPTPAAGGWTSTAGAGSAGSGGYGAGGYQAGGPETADQIYARVTAEGRNFSVGEAIGRGWEVVSANLGLMIGAAVIWMLCSVAGAIPCVGILIGLGVTPIVQAGIYRLALKLHRDEPAEFGDVFSTFSTSYLQLLLNTIVQAILIGVTVIPGYALIFVGSAMAERSEGVGLVLMLVGFLIMMPPAIYLGVSWIFSAPLIVDKGLDFWPAMELSRKVAGNQFFSVLGLLFLVGLIFLAGVVALCVGVLVSAPLALAAIAVAYDRLFGHR
jgi:hypothetical protein